MVDWIYKGTCWKFGDNIGVDGDLMPLEFAMARETRPEILKDHLMAGLEPGFHTKVSAGDILVAGKRFAQGNPHIQGLIGIQGNGLGLVVESIQRGSLRNAVAAGLPILPECPEVTSEAETGDQLEVNFETGTFRNITRGTEKTYVPLDPQLLNTIALGGWEPMVRQRLSVENK